MPRENNPMTTESDLFDKLRAIVLAADRLDRGTQLQLNLMLRSCLERALDADQEELCQRTTE